MKKENKQIGTIEHAKWRDFHSTGGDYGEPNSEKLYPVFECVKHNGHLLFTCPVCKQVRMHGAADKFGEANGSRISHCDCWSIYMLREVKGKWKGGYKRGHIEKD